jgi:hypothetical protein
MDEPRLARWLESRCIRIDIEIVARWCSLFLLPQTCCITLGTEDRLPYNGTLAIATARNTFGNRQAPA